MMEDDTSSYAHSETSLATPTGQTPSSIAAAHGGGHGPGTGPVLGPGPPSEPTTSTDAGTLTMKRKRGAGLVTLNACTECRKKRAKCDGNSPCGRCRIQEVGCVYEVPVRQSKEKLRNEIEQLRQRQHSSDQVIAALLRPELWEQVLQQLRGGRSVDTISDWLSEPKSMAFAGFDQRPHHQATLPSSSLEPLHTYQDPNTGSLANDMSLGLGSTANVGAPGAGGGEGGGGSLVPGMDPTGEAWSFTPHAQDMGQSERAEALHNHMMMTWTADVQAPPQIRVGSWAVMDPIPPQGPIPKLRGMDQVLASDVATSIETPTRTWTGITSDSNLVQHLLALYFCWEYPTFASLSKEHFMRDFQDGRDRYCSSILVNALLALGCRFSNQPSTRGNPDDPYSSGDHFFKESLRLLHLKTDHHDLTTIQALGIMSIREASCGRDSESWYYAGQSIRLALEMGLHNINGDGEEGEIAVQSATFWGAFALDHAWSLATGSLPQCSCFFRLPPKPGIIDDIEASFWIPYTDDGAPLQRSCEQPSNVRSVYKCFCELSELVHQSLYMLHSPGRPLTSRDLLGIYTQFLNWYDRIPEVLRLGHNFTPAVLFAHMYYHFAILLLFRPLLKLRIIGSKVLPRDVCSQAADAIQGLLRSYSQLYTLRHTPSFVPYFVLTSSIVHLAISATSHKSQNSATGSPSSHGGMDSMDGMAGEGGVSTPNVDSHAAQAISQGISDLTEMAPCHHFAQQALNILRYLARKWNIDIRANGKGVVPKELDDYSLLVRPQTNSLNFFAPHVREEDFMSTLTRSAASGKLAATATATAVPMQSQTSMPALRPGAAHGSSSKEAQGGGGAQGGRMPSAAETTEKTALPMENPLFWPFPMQGRPMLPDGRELEKAGFEYY